MTSATALPQPAFLAGIAADDWRVWLCLLILVVAWPVLRRVRHAFLPAHERLIRHLRPGPEPADHLRRRIFAERAESIIAREHVRQVCSRIAETSAALVTSAGVLEKNRTEIDAINPDLAAVYQSHFAHVAEDLAQSMGARQPTSNALVAEIRSAPPTQQGWQAR